MAAARPIADSVNIPLPELPHRTHELPRPTTCVYVAGPTQLTTQTVTWLRAHGRQAQPAPRFAFVAPESHAPPRRLWSPNELLLQALPHLAPGRALDIACGTGRDAVYLAARGWDVTGVDILPDALVRAARLAARYPRVAGRVCWIQADVERDPGAVLGEYDLITMFRYLHRPLLPIVWSWLKPGATFLCEAFTPTHRDRYGRPADIRRAATCADLAACLPAPHIISASDTWREREHTARLWLQRSALAQAPRRLRITS